MRKPKSLQWVPIMMCATQLNPDQLNHYFTALPVRAREHQIRAPKKHIIWGLSMKGVYLFSNPTNYYNDIASAHICALMTRMCDRVLTIKPNLYTGMGYTGELGTIST